MVYTNTTRSSLLISTTKRCPLGGHGRIYIYILLRTKAIVTIAHLLALPGRNITHSVLLTLISASSFSAMDYPFLAVTARFQLRLPVVMPVISFFKPFY